jgi:hypothetical protein
MKSFRDDLIDRMKTGWGRFVLASWSPDLFAFHSHSFRLPRHFTFLPVSLLFWLSCLPFAVCTHFYFLALFSFLLLLCVPLIMLLLAIYCRPLQFITWTIIFKGGFFAIFSRYVRYSTLLHLPPLRFHCVGECWDRTQEWWNFALTARDREDGYRSHLIHNHNLLFPEILCFSQLLISVQ